MTLHNKNMKFLQSFYYYKISDLSISRIKTSTLYDNSNGNIIKNRKMFLQRNVNYVSFLRQGAFIMSLGVLQKNKNKQYLDKYSNNECC